MYSTHPNICQRKEVVLFSVSRIVITLTEDDYIRERFFDKITWCYHNIIIMLPFCLTEWFFFWILVIPTHLLLINALGCIGVIHWFSYSTSSWEFHEKVSTEALVIQRAKDWRDRGLVKLHRKKRPNYFFTILALRRS